MPLIPIKILDVILPTLTTVYSPVTTKLISVEPAKAVNNPIPIATPICKHIGIKNNADLPIGRYTNNIVINPLNITDKFACPIGKFCSLIKTEKNIATAVGGTIINGKFVINPLKIQPKPQVNATMHVTA